MLERLHFVNDELSVSSRNCPTFRVSISAHLFAQVACQLLLDEVFHALGWIVQVILRKCAFLCQVRFPQTVRAQEACGVITAGLRERWC